MTITAAPAPSAISIAGTEARMRVSSVMRPSSSCGTLRSARMKTRRPDTLPAAIRSAKRRTFIHGCSVEAAHFTFAPRPEPISPRTARPPRITRRLPRPSARRPTEISAMRFASSSSSSSSPRWRPSPPPDAQIGDRWPAAAASRAAGERRRAAGAARSRSGRRRGGRRRRRDAGADGLLQPQPANARGQAAVPARARADRERLRARRRRPPAHRGAGRESARRAGLRGHRAPSRRPGPAAEDARRQLRAARLSAAAGQDPHGRADDRRGGGGSAAHPARLCRARRQPSI